MTSITTPPESTPAFQAGWRCRTGECALTNPYKLMTKEHSEWVAGYEQADRLLRRPWPATLSGEDDPNGVQ